MRIPFGVSRFDEVIGGGAPPGSLVLLSGEAGAGAREFMYTSAVMHALARADAEQFSLLYGELAPDAEVPPETHYLSFTADADRLRREIAFAISDDVVDAATPELRFRDLSAEYFGPSPVPRDWYRDETTSLQDLGDDRTDDLLSALGTYLSTNAPGNLVCIDSLTDLVAAVSEDLGWTDVALLMKGLAKAAHRWGCLVLLLVSRETLTDRQHGHLAEAADGTLSFEWESGGSQRARTMVVREFRGVLSRLEDENVVRFETEIHDAGFDVSDVRKIR